LGDSTLESQKAYLSAGRSAAFRFRAGTSGITGVAQLYVDSLTTASTVIVGIYADQNHHPGALLSTGSVSALRDGSWNELALSAGSLTADSQYWLAVLSIDGTLHYRDRSRGSCKSETSAQANLSSLPTTWSTGGSSSNCPISAYVTPVPAMPPADPLPPVSPVEPTPPISPEAPTELTPPTEPTPPPPTPPTASFTYSPTAPVLGQSVTFDGASSTCPSAPCTYEWSDDGGVTRPIPPLWPLGSGQTLSFTFEEVGTKYVRLVVTDAAGQTATVEHNVAVADSPPPPPPAAPANTALPTISGTIIEGQTLSASAGGWSGSPVSYVYQWQGCNSSGGGCSNIEGATASTYTLTSSDVDHTLRVVVTATNEGGSSAASSAATAMVSAPAPVSEPEPEPVSPPTNTVMPAVEGATTRGDTLTATSGTWTGNPTSYAYQWRHCNSSGKSCTNISGAAASTYTLAQGDVGDTMRVMVTATNEGGSSSMRSPTTAKVTAPAPAAPTNTTLPVISGTTTEGQQLSATAGIWTGSPTSTAYQWQDCDSAGANCADIAGASSSSYTLTGGDVGSTIRVVVTASNEGGSTPATSAATATVVAAESSPAPPPPPTTGQQTSCFVAPGACGYPDPNYDNVGTSAACSSLTPSGEITVSTAGATVQNMNISGGVNIAAKNVTLTNDCISGSGYHVVFLNSGATGFQITHTDVFGSPSVQEAINNNNGNAGALADHDYIYNCGECVHGAWTLTNSYVTTNATISGEHYEDIYCSDETFVAEHDVLINPHEQTANLFCNADGGGGGPADNHITLTNSLLAGAGYSLYPQGNSTSVGTSTMKIVGNRFARCLTKTVFDREGDATCSGGPDANGYWPNGGYYGIDAYTYCPPTAGQEWSNNVWDDNDESVGC
jgi:hypothetical protein